MMKIILKLITITMTPEKHNDYNSNSNKNDFDSSPRNRKKGLTIREDKVKAMHYHQTNYGTFHGANNWKVVLQILEESQNPIEIDEFLEYK